MGMAILTGAGLIDASAENKINVHATSRIEGQIDGTDSTKLAVDLSDLIKDDEALATGTGTPVYGFVITESGDLGASIRQATVDGNIATFTVDGTTYSAGEKVLVMVDFYKEMSARAMQLEITPDQFAGYYYLEASTLFRRKDNGVDMPAEFVIPNAKIQTAFNFSMASSGDPSKEMCLAA